MSIFYDIRKESPPSNTLPERPDKIKTSEVSAETQTRHQMAAMLL